MSDMMSIADMLARLRADAASERFDGAKLGPTAVRELLMHVDSLAARLAAIEQAERERDAALADLERAREVLRDARDVVEGRTAHLYRSDCPSPRHWLDRDNECPACATLVRIDAALAAKLAKEKTE